MVDQQRKFQKDNNKDFDIDKLKRLALMILKTSRENEETKADDKSNKTCNCKKSECLKLYCECFAGGLYCADSCECENCLNTPDFEEDVTEARNSLLARNPLAFAPKVVSSDTPTDIKENGIRSSEASMRHIRGCSCKKSKCLKKYCECFQAGVGCSSECRCEGCQNSYGQNTADQSTVENGKKQDNLFNGVTDLETANANQFSTERGPTETPSIFSNDEFGASTSMPLPSSANLGRYDLMQQNGNRDSQLNNTTHETPKTVPSFAPTEAVQDISSDFNVFLSLENIISLPDLI